MYQTTLDEKRAWGREEGGIVMERSKVIFGNEKQCIQKGAEVQTEIYQ